MTNSSSFWQHVEELRTTLLRCLGVLLIAFVMCLCFQEALFDVLTIPLQKMSGVNRETIIHERIINPGPNTIRYTLEADATILGPLPTGVNQVDQITYELKTGSVLEMSIAKKKNDLMIFGPVDGFLTSLKVCFWTALVVSSPVWMGCLLTFVAPALNQRERRYLIPFLTGSCLFLFLGVGFAFYVTIPMANRYLYAFNAAIGTNLWSLSNYLNYTVMILLANGLAFELFVVLLLLMHLNIVDAQMMGRYRRHAIVGAFILGALLTPPDIPSQLMLACPLIALYEVAIAYGRIKRHYWA